MTHGIFHAYGLFWQKDEIDWNPGRGNRDSFHLCGRVGLNLPSLRIADFRAQQGIYILYGNYGPHYVGLTRVQTLGTRLKQHLTADPGDKWDRFSWFSFRRVLKKQDPRGLQTFGDMPTVRSSDPAKAMGDIEALLIKAMALTNVAQMKFSHALEWKQIKRNEVSGFAAKLGRR